MAGIFQRRQHPACSFFWVVCGVLPYGVAAAQHVVLSPLLAPALIDASSHRANPPEGLAVLPQASVATPLVLARTLLFSEIAVSQQINPVVLAPAARDKLPRGRIVVLPPPTALHRVLLRHERAEHREWLTTASAERRAIQPVEPDDESANLDMIKILRHLFAAGSAVNLPGPLMDP
jgi:hypothetical protein